MKPFLWPDDKTLFVPQDPLTMVEASVVMHWRILLVWLVTSGLSGMSDGRLLADERQATQPDSIRASKGFEVQLLRSAQEGEGSWISMTFDPQGRILVGLDQQGLGRLMLAEDGASATFEQLANTESLRHVRGVLYAHDSIYVAATDSQGVYRLRDENGDGQFESPTLLQSIPYQSRYGHGTNQIVLGPDEMLYVVCGNDVVFPDAMDVHSPYRNPQNDWCLPSPHDGGQDNRVGYIARVDAEGKSWSILAGGFRNPFDMAFNRDGEMFTWDADMEWDVGLPWYRPTRINHVISGGEYGWRWGTGKWASWFPDSLPSTFDTGYSSPTGMIFGHHSNWPERYKKMLFIADWQLGRVIMMDIVPKGATYEVKTSELFLEGGPLNVCDLTFGPDGAMYLITGGRGSQSGLYRVAWLGDHQDGFEHAAKQDSEMESDAQGRAARAQRIVMERYQQTQDANALDQIWPVLNSEDPWLRFSARIALENQPLTAWLDRYEATDEPRTATLASLALARQGDERYQSQLINKLLQLDWQTVSSEELLVVLRALQLSIIRQGLPAADLQVAITNQLKSIEQNTSLEINWLATELQVKLQAPGAKAHLLKLLSDATTQEEQFQYAKTLARLQLGWEVDDARLVVDWLERSRRAPGGKLVETTWRTLRSDFEAQFSAYSHPAFRIACLFEVGARRQLET